MRHRNGLGYAAVVVVLAVGLTACGGGSSDDADNPPADGGGKPSLPECPLDALETADKPVDITYWHAMSRANEEALRRLTNEFNAQQSDVRVTLSAAASYTDNTTRFKAGLTTGKLPDLLQGEDTSLQILVDSQSVLPMAACVEADGADISDLAPRAVAYYSLDDVLYAMPFNNSNLILYYDKALFEKAGLDPNRPPKSFADVEAASRKIVQSRAADFGIALKVDSPPIEHWLAKSGHTIVDNDNGRTDRATQVTFNDETGESIFAWMDEMVDSKLALSTTGQFDHYLAVGNGRAAMTIDSSAALGTIAQLFAAGQYQKIKLGVGPMPGPDSPDGGVLVGGAANFIVRQSSPEKQAAAYEFAKYLASPKVQSEWAAATGYVPISQSAATVAPLKQQYAEKPEYKVAFDQLLAGPVNAATAGPVLGAYGSGNEGMRGAIVSALSQMLEGRLTPDQAIQRAAEQADDAISKYNERIG
jgi:sn-glycerol 3-phosphate transport system substrate-binding protein